jgi:hypothetical protein
MPPLPPVAPATGWRSSARLARDHYIRLDGNDYSVHPAVIGRRIKVTAGLDRVRLLGAASPELRHVSAYDGGSALAQLRLLADRHDVEVAGVPGGGLE